MTITTIITLIIIGLLAGILSGLVGVGGGIIMVPLFVIFLGLTQHNAQGLSLAVMLPPVTFWLFTIITLQVMEQILIGELQL